MKRKIYILSACIISSVVLLSCTEENIGPVNGCTFSEVIDNASNPNNALYEQILQEYVDRGLPGVSVAIETPEDGWWVGCAGLASIEDDIAMEPCHIHPASGMDIPYTAALVFRLYEEEQLDLDDPISAYLPEDMISRIANGEEATIRQLLGHTAGLYDTYYSDNALRDVLNNPFAERTTESNFEDYFYDRKAKGAPGEDFWFSDAGYDLLGMIIEEVSGKSLAAYFDQEIKEPLGLTHTYHKNAPGYPDLPNLVNGYIEIYPGQIQNATEIDLAEMRISNGHVDIIGTPYEFARFYQELLRGNVLEAATLEIMLSDKTVLNDTLSYCLGIANRQNEYGSVYEHRGILYGITGLTSYFPNDDVTCSFITNLGGAQVADMQGLFFEMVEELRKVIFTGSRD